MSTEVLVRALAVFIFHNRGPADVQPVALLLFSLWAVLALAYLALAPEPYPIFFGVPAHRARWIARDPFPRKWVALGMVIGGWLLWRFLYP